MKIISSTSFSGLFEIYQGDRVITRCIKINGLWFLYLSNEFIETSKREMS